MARGGVIHGTASWPGVVAIESCTYTISHGVAPSTAVLRIQPQKIAPAPFGALVIADGQGTVNLFGCRLDAVKTHQDESGVYWTLEIVDRRWRWRELGALSGCYNQLDPFGKLIPWTIRSPKQLATLCLDAMGEVNYVLDFPAGINYPGPYTRLPIINITGTNPPVNWVGVPPAVALQQLADQYSLRVIYQVSTDTILVSVPGIGGPLPTGGKSIHRQGPSLKNPETPDSIAVLGAPTRYQVRLVMEAVGEEWNGSYRPIDDLSYAPKKQKAVAQETSISPDNPNGQVPALWQVTVNGQVINIRDNSGSTAGGAAAIAAAINANPALAAAGITAAVVGAGADAQVIVTGAPGQAFDVTVDVQPGFVGAGPIGITTVLETAPESGKSGWLTCHPPMFGVDPTGLISTGIQATDRLTPSDALKLAQRSVYKCYQVANVAGDWTTGIAVPGITGRLLRKEQVILEDTQVDQIVPEKNDPGIIDQFGVPLTVNFYSGYSKDKPAAAYGAHVRVLNPGINYVKRAKQVNAKPQDQIFIPFTLDPVRYLMTFSDYVFQLTEPSKFNDPALPENYLRPTPPGFIYPSIIRLQTGIQVRDPLTNAPLCFFKIAALPGGGDTNPRVYSHPDVQLNITCKFDAFSMPEAVTILEADPLIRAQHYLEAHATEYLISGGQIIDYNGIVPIDLDGAIQQVTYSVGDDGATTTASLNTEHSPWIPPYPTRRRAEFLPPVLQPKTDQPGPQISMPEDAGAAAGGIR